MKDKGIQLSHFSAGTKSRRTLSASHFDTTETVALCPSYAGKQTSKNVYS